MLYQMKVTFESDRQLTNEELEEIMDALILQVEEPTTHDGDGVGYELTNQSIKTYRG